jgi:hypothetical protein
MMSPRANVIELAAEALLKCYIWDDAPEDVRAAYCRDAPLAKANIKEAVKKVCMEWQLKGKDKLQNSLSSLTLAETICWHDGCRFQKALLKHAPRICVALSQLLAPSPDVCNYKGRGTRKESPPAASDVICNKIISLFGRWANDIPKTVRFAMQITLKKEVVRGILEEGLYADMSNADDFDRMFNSVRLLLALRAPGRFQFLAHCCTHHPSSFLLPLTTYRFDFAVDRNGAHHLSLRMRLESIDALPREIMPTASVLPEMQDVPQMLFLLQPEIQSRLLEELMICPCREYEHLRPAFVKGQSECGRVHCVMVQWGCVVKLAFFPPLSFHAFAGGVIRGKDLSQPPCFAGRACDQDLVTPWTACPPEMLNERCKVHMY